MLRAVVQPRARMVDECYHEVALNYHDSPQCVGAVSSLESEVSSSVAAAPSLLEIETTPTTHYGLSHLIVSNPVPLWVSYYEVSLSVGEHTSTATHGTGREP